MNRDATTPVTPDPEFLLRLRQHFAQKIPHAGALGMEVESVCCEAGQARLPLRPEFIGDVQRDRVHTGVITTFIDSVCGLAVSAHIGVPQAIATLDLRVDYLRPTPAHGDLHCRAECTRLTRHVAFVRATVWHRPDDLQVAVGVATFMRTATRPPVDS